MTPAKLRKRSLRHWNVIGPDGGVVGHLIRRGTTWNTVEYRLYRDSSLSDRDLPKYRRLKDARENALRDLGVEEPIPRGRHAQ